ncbi:transcription repressor NadR [Brevibacillus fulvus]|uniref:Transcriptional regulator of NAD metabolism n=1 Tax=Brevibacillus fulvus TaxID=1125967 RepID=A0A938XTE1_9BACL|nr:transcription repressor NadR [Brevibacillus fulvus]MBM7589732.1 transcriptional regulator of NAD metabolism [Brevibacillus fulvus]
MSDRTERQKKLLNELASVDGAISGSELAERCQVTRQVVVHDIAILRAAGEPIVSTPRGYLLQRSPRLEERVLSVYHPPELTGVELQILVDYGFQIKDVIVEHPFYGELRGSLQLSSRRDVADFLKQIEANTGTLLSTLTDGYHLHTIQANSFAYLQEAIEQLQKNGIRVMA